LPSRLTQTIGEFHVGRELENVAPNPVAASALMQVVRQIMQGV
jgi:hypothetical protein